MADLSRDDITRATRDAMNDLRSELNTIRDVTQRIDQRTNDLDRSQDEIRRIVELAPRLEDFARTDRFDRINNEIAAIKSQLGTTNQYLQQVAKYLEGLDQRARREEETSQR